ncbi:hypothetical protein Adt_32993 [Abeliophyllum distichum]|uniref:Uncharacterized protein n=1 Tax=Abeliophyllum distichum TaxID=126358 RepID=A0ABD1QUZ7_9LAMI
MKNSLAIEAWGERRLQLEDFSQSTLYNLIDVCGWSRIAKTAYKIYSQLVHEFYADFNPEIGIHRTAYYGQTLSAHPEFVRTTINDANARFLYDLAHGRKIDMGSYIYTLIITLGFQTYKRHTAIFPALISRICEEAEVQISTAELVVKSNGPINRFALENVRRHTPQASRTAPATEKQPQEEHPAAPHMPHFLET